MKYNLPEDLKKIHFRNFTTKRIIYYIFSLLCSTAGWFIATWILKPIYERNDVKLPTQNTISLIVLGVALVIFVVSIIFHKEPDNTCAGKIEDVKVNTKVKSESPEKPTRESLYKQHAVELYVRNSENAAAWATVYKGTDKNYADKFKVDADIFHICGTNTTVFLPTDSDTVVTCPVCGITNQKEDETCHACGHTLIKSIQQIT